MEKKKRKKFTKSQVEIIKQFSKEITERIQKDIDDCIEKKNYFGAFKQHLEKQTFESFANLAELYHRKKYIF